MHDIIPKHLKRRPLAPRRPHPDIEFLVIRYEQLGFGLDGYEDETLLDDQQCCNQPHFSKHSRGSTP
jgi:hypothetical protein